MHVRFELMGRLLMNTVLDDLGFLPRKVLAHALKRSLCIGLSIPGLDVHNKYQYDNYQLSPVPGATFGLAIGKLESEFLIKPMPPFFLLSIIGACLPAWNFAEPWYIWFYNLNSDCSRKAPYKAWEKMYPPILFKVQQDLWPKLEVFLTRKSLTSWLQRTISSPQELLIVRIWSNWGLLRPGAEGQLVFTFQYSVQVSKLGIQGWRVLLKECQHDWSLFFLFFSFHNPSFAAAIASSCPRLPWTCFMVPRVHAMARTETNGFRMSPSMNTSYMQLSIHDLFLCLLRWSHIGCIQCKGDAFMTDKKFLSVRNLWSSCLHRYSGPGLGRGHLPVTLPTPLFLEKESRDAQTWILSRPCKHRWTTFSNFPQVADICFSVFDRTRSTRSIPREIMPCFSVGQESGLGSRQLLRLSAAFDEYSSSLYSFLSIPSSFQERIQLNSRYAFHRNLSMNLGSCHWQFEKGEYRSCLLFPPLILIPCKMEFRGSTATVAVLLYNRFRSISNCSKFS